MTGYDPVQANYSETDFLSSKMPTNKPMIKPPGFREEGSSRAFIITLTVTICRGKGSEYREHQQHNQEENGS